MTIKTKSLLNIQKVIENGTLDMLCYTMIAYDSRASDSIRLACHSKAKVIDKGEVKEIYFQDVLLSFSDISLLEEAFTISKKNHPEISEKIDMVLDSISSWRCLNKDYISKNTTANMFSIT